MIIGLSNYHATVAWTARAQSRPGTHQMPQVASVSRVCSRTAGKSPLRSLQEEQPPTLQGCNCFTPVQTLLCVVLQSRPCILLDSEAIAYLPFHEFDSESTDSIVGDSV